jgi:two-component system, NarL family, response regulator LiaR
MNKTTSQPVRVMLVDGHAMVRRGLATFLMVFDDLQLVGETKSGEAAIQLCAEVLPDVVLMDMVMPDMDGPTVTRAIRQQFPQIQVIALTSFREGELIKSAFEAGVSGYLLKDISADQLAEAIRTATSGRATISVEAAQALIETVTQPPEQGLDVVEREQEAPTLIVEGRNNNQIAEKLVMTSSAIKAHVNGILSKLSIPVMPQLWPGIGKLQDFSPTKSYSAGKDGLDPSDGVSFP